METKNCYSIRYVANLTGLKPHVIRTWEKRYSAVTPRRTETNRRVYSADDIQRLRLLKVAVKSGQTISHVAPLKTEELTALNSRIEQVLDNSKIRASGPEASDQTEQIVNQAFERIVQLDRMGLEAVLEGAAVKLPRQLLLSKVIQPLFDRIGAEWASGRLKIINEHMATIVVRSFLWDMLRSTALADPAPKIVVAAPAGQWHETGALVVALTASECGWQPMYFGPNLPAEEIAAAVQKTESRALALSICHHTDETRLALELKRLNRYVGRRVQIYIGGHEVGRLKNWIEPLGGVCIETMEQFRSDLESHRSEK